MADNGLTRDAFLGGRVMIRQPRQGYRAGVDPVFLAASVLAKPGESLLDLGCGVGTAALCAGTRLPGLRLVGLERQADHAALAVANAAENGLEMEVITGDLTAMPPALRQRQFDHIIANPPYFLRHSSVAGQHDAREAAMGEDTPLADWVSVAARRLRPGGSLTFIHRAERLPELITAFASHLGALELKPLTPRAGRAARLLLLRGRKERNAAFQLHAGLLLHSGASHTSDAEDYTAIASAILREAAPLDFNLSV
ncbi:methyltransferase [Pseudooceanicola sp.]|uniref:tRNA1(Val) (adenine(37)-N6)-methyltransferase n=1 Tax=Pseudooceanicola sp. TaxID=1914328 RepID=UPI002608DEF2|nr:methyltransferase [Pseudooceanicola sp.]MDF1857261.1 methyltransferase [Pseudooceanicola sp.]